MIGVTLLLLSACDFSGCKAVVAEEQSLFQEWDELRKQELNRYRQKLREYNEELTKWQITKDKKMAECRLDPASFLDDQADDEIVKRFKRLNQGTNIEAYIRDVGVLSFCDTVTGNQLLDRIRLPEPQDTSSSYPPAVTKYVLSKRVIVNNPKCFSATEVATAQEEVRRLTDE